MMNRYFLAEWGVESYRITTNVVSGFRTVHLNEKLIIGTCIRSLDSRALPEISMVNKYFFQFTLYNIFFIFSNNDKIVQLANTVTSREILFLVLYYLFQ